MPDPTEQLAVIRAEYWDWYEDDDEDRYEDTKSFELVRNRLPHVLAAVESVLALHKPVPRYTAAGWEEVSFESRVDAAEYGDTDNVQEFTVCHECGQIETHDGGEERCYEYSIWPCATVRAIESALGGDDDAE